MVNIIVSEDGSPKWFGLPEAWEYALNARFDEPNFLKQYPDVALRTLMIEAKQQVEGLRPFQEYADLLKEACPVIRKNPKQKYKALGKIGSGGFGSVFKVKRI